MKINPVEFRETLHKIPFSQDSWNDLITLLEDDGGLSRTVDKELFAHERCAGNGSCPSKQGAGHILLSGHSEHAGFGIPDGRCASVWSGSPGPDQILQGRRAGKFFQQRGRRSGVLMPEIRQMMRFTDRPKKNSGQCETKNFPLAGTGAFLCNIPAPENKNIRLFHQN